jgi:hypothetical protein
MTRTKYVLAIMIFTAVFGVGVTALAIFAA